MLSHNSSIYLQGDYFQSAPDRFPGSSAYDRYPGSSAYDRYPSSSPYDRGDRFPGSSAYDRYPGAGAGSAPGVLVGPRPTPYRPNPAAGFSSRPSDYYNNYNNNYRPNNSPYRDYDNYNRG